MGNSEGGLFFGSLLAFGIAVAGAVVLSASAPAGYMDGPPPGFSGGFGEQSCHACHFAEDPNQPPGTLLLSGIPGRYTPGESYPLTVTLARPGMALGGFQLTSRFEESGSQAGELLLEDGDAERIAVTTDGEVQYAHHRRAGAALVAPDTARWTVLWQAPPAAGAVRFDAAANAADGDDSIYGDHVYTAAKSVRGAGTP
jgi:hypothetical protein